MFGEPSAFQVFDNGQPVTEVMTQRRCIDWIMRNDSIDATEAHEVLYGDGGRYRIRQSLDERDTESARARQAAREALTGPQVGDAVTFPDGVRRWISHAWPDGVQTSDGGSWHWMSNGDMSFSGGLHPSIPTDTLTEDGTAERSAWFFHHEHAKAHNSITAKATVRAWRTTAVLR